MASQTRPRRLRLPDFADRLISLPDGSESWELASSSGQGPDILILGLGPNGTPAINDLGAKESEHVHWLDAPRILKATGAQPPPEWRRVAPEDALKRSWGKVYFYRPGMRLAPEFFGPLLAKISVAATGESWRPDARGLAWLPGSRETLLSEELRVALMGRGLAVSEAMPEANLPGLLRAWGGVLPHLAISINFRGLDPEGRVFEICRALKIPLAIWLVDNPWNLLSGITLPWWREACVSLTDASFLPELRANGAKFCHYLPLGASQRMLAFHSERPWIGSPAFVGRSAFPGRKGFFSGVKIPAKLMARAHELLAEESAEKPDFHWWQKLCRVQLWPGREERLPACGADICSRDRRAAWLKTALSYGLEIIGDEAWRQLLPGAAILPPVDYYGSLPNIYAKACASLNVTSLLLPQSLSQRHFDVWAAGGFLLSDATKGLELFPEELTRPVTLLKPEDFGEKLEYFASHQAEKKNLAAEWRALIRKRHGYEKRVMELDRLASEWAERA